MKKNILLITILIISLLFILSVWYNYYQFEVIKQVNEEKEKELNYNEKEHWYDIKSNSLFINYQIFIKNDKEDNLKRIIKKFTWINAQSIYIENIDWIDLKFLKILSDKIYFPDYHFSFIKYNDENNFIFDYIKTTSRWPNDIFIDFTNKLEWENTLIKTYKKLLSIIKEIWKNKNPFNNKYPYIKWITITWFNNFWDISNWVNTFYNSYKLSDEELKIICDFDSEYISIRFKDITPSQDEYILKTLKTTDKNIWYFWKYSKKVFKWEIYINKDF